MSKKLIIANWKMSPATWGEAQGLLEFVSERLASFPDQRFSLAVCPPFVFLEEAAKLFSQSDIGNRASLGAQDIFWDDAGADTGEISGPQLTALGVRYVIVGHSERRWKLGESDDIVNKKLIAVLRNGMIPIVCLGERTRDAGYEKFLRTQALATFHGLSAGDIERCLIAYEPVWVISTNPDARPDTPKSALESMAVIRDALGAVSAKILYGGSVTPANAHDFLSQADIGGVLVGGASVRKEEFGNILTLANAV